MSRYPNVHVTLTGRDGNAFSIIAAVTAELRRHVGPDVADEFASAAMDSPSYDALLRLVMQTVEVS